MIKPFLVLLLLQLPPHVRSQNSPPPGIPSGDPSIIAIIVFLIAALFLITFFTIYIRRCSNEGGGSIRTAPSMRRATEASPGLNSSVIETFPTFVYSAVKGLNLGKIALECAVCLNEYEDEEKVRLIPKCDHVFHPDCIDVWFANHVTCPVCRANLVPNSGELGLGLAGDERNDVVADSVSISVVEDSVVNVQESVTQIFPRLFDRFRSHSTGHSLVQPGENLDRFTLRLPADVRKQVVNSAMLNRARMVGERSRKNGYRNGGEISGRRKAYKRIGSLDRVVVRSELWVLSQTPSFLSRALSIRSPRVVPGIDEASTPLTTPKGSKMVDKIPLNNLEPKSCETQV